MAQYNFDNIQTTACQQGATFFRPFTWTEKNGDLILLDNYTAKMQVRKNYGGKLLIELSTENGRIYYDSNNQIVLYISAEETQLLDAGKYVYDLELTDIVGTEGVIRLLEGEFFVSPEVTL